MLHTAFPGRENALAKASLVYIIKNLQRAKTMIGRLNKANKSDIEVVHYTI